jgi:DNA-binding response OmpR family regulator
MNMNETYTPPHILIVDDESNVRFVLARALRQINADVVVTSSGREALERIAKASFDLILLDLYLGNVNGLQVLEAARQKDPEVVVIILTGQGSLESAVEALRLGAFDYLFKPARPEVIRQRVRDGLHKRQQARQKRQIMTQIETLRHMLNELETNALSVPYEGEDGRFLHRGPLVIDRRHRAATLNNNLLDLTTTEFELLVCLVEEAPQPVSPEELARCALGYKAGESDARDTIKWHIHQMRRKIEPDPGRPRYIKTVRYKGYFWSGDSPQ